MERTYTIPEGRREEMLKAIARFERKAEAYGKVFSATLGSPYAKKVNVTAHGEKIAEELVECFDMTLDAEVICKDGYSVVAKIEHLPEANFVHVFAKDANESWFKCAPICEHCGTKHFRKSTFIVRNENGTERQVGSTCLKDYCGISPNVFAQMRELEEYIEVAEIKDCIDDEYEYRGEKLYNFRKVLALAFDVNKMQGYVRSSESRSNKGMMINALHDDEKPSEESYAKADAMIEDCKHIENSEENSNWLYIKTRWLVNNVKALALNGYCKIGHFGYIAYAPIAYDEYVTAKAEYEAKKACMASAAKTSGWIGNVGDKITFDVSEMKLMTAWENAWGGVTYLYRFTDADGNVLIWYASKRMMDNCQRVTAKVKSHSEHDGVKQTIVTNCKAA